MRNRPSWDDYFLKMAGVCAERATCPRRFVGAVIVRDNHPIGRIASPDEVAAFFTYMASDLASFFTGAILMMDGGFTAK